MEVGSRGFPSVTGNREVDKVFNPERKDFLAQPAAGTAAWDVASGVLSSASMVDGAGTNATFRSATGSDVGTFPDSTFTFPPLMNGLHGAPDFPSFGHSVPSQADTKSIIQDETQHASEREAFDDMVVLTDGMVVTSAPLSDGGAGHAFEPSRASFTHLQESQSQEDISPGSEDHPLAESITLMVTALHENAPKSGSEVSTQEPVHTSLTVSVGVAVGELGSEAQLKQDGNLEEAPSAAELSGDQPLIEEQLGPVETDAKELPAPGAGVVLTQITVTHIMGQPPAQEHQGPRERDAGQSLVPEIVGVPDASLTETLFQAIFDEQPCAREDEVEQLPIAGVETAEPQVSLTVVQGQLLVQEQSSPGEDGAEQLSTPGGGGVEPETTSTEMPGVGPAEPEATSTEMQDQPLAEEQPSPGESHAEQLSTPGGGGVEPETTSPEMPGVSVVDNNFQSEKPPPPEHTQQEEAAVNRKEVSEQDVQAIKGQKVLKKFGKKVYLGHVVNYDPEFKWFKVVYEDGDEEDLELEEVKVILVAPGPLPTVSSSKKRRHINEDGDEEKGDGDGYKKSLKKTKKIGAETSKGSSRSKDGGRQPLKKKRGRPKGASIASKSLAGSKSHASKGKLSTINRVSKSPKKAFREAESLQKQEEKVILKSKSGEVSESPSFKTPTRTKLKRGGKGKRKAAGTNTPMSGKGGSSSSSKIAKGGHLDLLSPEPTKTGKIKRLTESSGKEKDKRHFSLKSPAIGTEVKDTPKKLNAVKRKADEEEIDDRKSKRLKKGDI